MLQQRIGVTVARNVTGGTYLRLQQQAMAWAQQLHAVLVERTHHLSLEEMCLRGDLEAIVVLEVDGPRVHLAGNMDTKGFAYHLGMAPLRLMQLRRGGVEHIGTALALKRGSRVLDCTLGMAADAALASYLVGEEGCVVGLEAAPLVHAVVAWGLAHHRSGDAELDAAIRRIRTVCTTAKAYLEQCAPDAFDVIYFDPMFRRPVQGSKGMDALRPLSYAEPLGMDVVELALQIAPRVVIKERSEFFLRKYGCREFVGGRSSRVKYGILRRGEETHDAQMVQEENDE